MVHFPPQTKLWVYQFSRQFQKIIKFQNFCENTLEHLFTFRVIAEYRMCPAESCFFGNFNILCAIYVFFIFWSNPISSSPVLKRCKLGEKRFYYFWRDCYMKTVKRGFSFFISILYLYSWVISIKISFM